MDGIPPIHCTEEKKVESAVNILSGFTIVLGLVIALLFMIGLLETDKTQRDPEGVKIFRVGSIFFVAVSFVLLVANFAIGGEDYVVFGDAVILMIHLAFWVSFNRMLKELD